MNSVMSHPSERQVAVSATKLLINNRWMANESQAPERGRLLHRLADLLHLSEDGHFETLRTYHANCVFESRAKGRRLVCAGTTRGASFE
jgi:hypothetical protein